MSCSKHEHKELEIAKAVAREDIREAVKTLLAVYPTLRLEDIAFAYISQALAFSGAVRDLACEGDDDDFEWTEGFLEVLFSMLGNALGIHVETKKLDVIPANEVVDAALKKAAQETKH